MVSVLDVTKHEAASPSPAAGAANAQEAAAAPPILGAGRKTPQASQQTGAKRRAIEEFSEEQQGNLSPCESLVRAVGTRGNEDGGSRSRSSGRRGNLDGTPRDMHMPLSAGGLAAPSLGEAAETMHQQRLQAALEAFEEKEDQLPPG